MEYSCTICNVKLLLVSCVLLILTTKGHCKFEVELSSGYRGVVIVKNDHGTIGGVCQNGWGYNSCVVICGQLGYSGGIPIDHVYQQYSIKLDRYLLANVVCIGDERRLSDCPYDTDTYACDLVMHQAACSCDEPNGKIISPPALEHPKVKLSLGFRGVVEVTRYEDTRLVCNTHWTDKECQVVCKQTGYSGGSPSIQYYPTKIDNVWLDHVVCSGTEETLDQCQHGLWGDFYCIPSDDKATCECDKGITSIDIETASPYTSEQSTDSSHSWLPAVIILFLVLVLVIFLTFSLLIYYMIYRKRFNCSVTDNQNVQNFLLKRKIHETQIETAINYENEENEARQNKLAEPEELHKLVERIPKLAIHKPNNKTSNESRASNISNLPDKHQRSHVKDTTKTTKSTTEEIASAEKSMDAPLPKPEAKDCYTYKGSDNLKGLALIFNIMKFKTLKLRQWSDTDADRLTFMWENAGFEVRRYENPTKQQLHSVIKYAQQKLRKRNHGCFVCCIMSHGGIDFIHTSDDDTVQIKEAILRPFGAKQLPEFAGYPKIFLLQCCRTEELSQINLTRFEVNAKHVRSLPYSSIADSTVSKDGQPDSNLSVSVTGFTHDGEDPNEKIRIPKDFFIGYACSQGERARRYQQMKGSAYFVYLVQNAEEKANNHADFNLKSLMDDVQEDFSKKRLSQVPIYISSLRKKIKLKLQKQ